MRFRAATLLCLIAIQSACTRIPALDDKVNPAMKRTTYPTLLPQADLPDTTAPDTVGSETEAELAARAAALRARAAALRAAQF
jgi:hypothetical protein